MSTDTTPAGVGTSAAERSTVVRIGLFALAGSLVALLALTRQIIPPVLVFVVVFVAIGVALGRSSNRKLWWAAAILPLLIVVINLPFALSDLGHPDSPAAFVPTVAILACGIATAVVAFLALRGRTAPASRVWGAVGALVVVAAAGSLVSANGLEDDVARPGDATLVAEGLAFPDRVEMPASADGLLVTNADTYHHVFAVEGTDVHVDLPGSTARRVDVDLSPGEYRYFCDLPGHESMEGTLVVQ